MYNSWQVHGRYLGATGQEATSCGHSGHRDSQLLWRWLQLQVYKYNKPLSLQHVIIWTHPPASLSLVPYEIKFQERSIICTLFHRWLQIAFLLDAAIPLHTAIHIT